MTILVGSEYSRGCELALSAPFFGLNRMGNCHSTWDFLSLFIFGFHCLARLTGLGLRVRVDNLLKVLPCMEPAL